MSQHNKGLKYSKYIWIQKDPFQSYVADIAG